MAMLRTQYSRGGDMGGMPIIIEEGIFTDESSTLSDMTAGECGRIELTPLPRTVGLVAKSLDGQTISDKLASLTTPFGTFAQCIQMGKTQMARIAPVQPVGPTGVLNQSVFSYRRQWVQLSAYVEPSL